MNEAATVYVSPGSYAPAHEKPSNSRIGVPTVIVILPSHDSEPHVATQFTTITSPLTAFSEIVNENSSANSTTASAANASNEASASVIVILGFSLLNVTVVVPVVASVPTFLNTTENDTSSSTGAVAGEYESTAMNGPSNAAAGTVVIYGM